MIMRAFAVLVATVAFFITIAADGGAGQAHAAMAGQPIGSSTVSTGTGTSTICLSAQHDSTAPGTPVVVIECNPLWPREQWSFANGVLSPWRSSSSVVSVSKSGFLVLAKRGTSPRMWTYGPAHELTTQVKTGTAFLTWLPGHGRQPWVTTTAGPGQTVYIFTRVG